MNNKSRAKRKDEQILERTRRKMQVRTNQMAPGIFFPLPFYQIKYLAIGHGDD
ncbi:MAG: hypothetical protein U5R06_16910 [candidate division KSB1 bacterium]|nr:hypothetical protein [candidate division KSB1 bacterium]